MRKFTFLLSFLFVVLGLSAQTNLVKNPSFESDFADWANGPIASYTDPVVKSGGAQNGTKYVEYVPAATTGFYQEIPVTAGKTYTVSFWYKASGDDTDARLWSNFKDGAGALVYLAANAADDPLRSNDGYLGTSTEWKNHSVTFVAPATATLFQLAVRAYNKGTVAYDNFSMIEVGATSEPTINVTPASLSFSAALNTQSALQTVTVSAANLSTAPTYTVTGADAAMFAATGTLTAAGGDINVVFTPASEGSKTAVLEIKSGGITKTVNLTGQIMIASSSILQNAGFETWTSGLPAPWYVVSTSVTGVTPAENTTLFAEGTKSIKIDASGASGTYNMAQSVTLIPGHNYTLTAKYYIEAGDGTDARLWCNYKTSETTFFTEAELIATGDYEKLRSGNANSSGSSYLPDVKGSWQTHTVTFTAPSNAVGFDFQFRTYRTAIVNWDGMSLVDNSLSGLGTVKEKLKLYAANGKINFEATTGETIEVYNTMGQRIFNALAAEGQNEVAVSLRGVAIVKVGNRVGKVIL